MKTSDIKPKPGISVVIPVKNEARRLADCLNGILGQTVEVDEIIIIDSGSNDGTQDIAKSFPKVKLLEIEPREFNHGDTRNLGVQHANGDFVLFTVGDAWAIDEFWIERLMAGFIDENVAGVCGSQVVTHAKDTNPIEWFRPQSEPKIRHFQFSGPEEFDAATSEEKKEACSWDDVTAIYRMSALKSIPFRRTVYGEDVFWAIDTLRSGAGLAYQPGARVYHFHLDNYETTLKRTISVSYLRYLAFGVLPGKIQVTKSTARSAYRLLRERGLGLKERFFWLRYNCNSARAISNGFNLFDRALTRGQAGLDELHEQYCGTPPLPLKRTLG